MRELIPWERGRVPVSRRERPLLRDEEFDPLWPLHREVNRFFDSAFRGFFWGFGIGITGFERVAAWPDIESTATDNEVRITVALPGFDQKDINVELANKVLTIKGERKAGSEGYNQLFSEHYYSRFERRIPLDWDVAEEQVAASFRNGVLTVSLPKPAEAQERRSAQGVFQSMEVDRRRRETYLRFCAALGAIHRSSHRRGSSASFGSAAVPAGPVKPRAGHVYVRDLQD